MKNNIITIFLVTMIFASCTPAKSTPTEKALFTSTSSPFPTVTFLATPTSNTIISAYYSGTSSDKWAYLRITNANKIAVQNLQIWICASQIHNFWKQDIQGITSFLVEPENLSKEYLQKYVYSDYCLPSGKNIEYNAILFNFKTFLANQDVGLAIRIKPDTEMVEKNYQGSLFIEIPTNLNMGTSDDQILIQLIGTFGDTLINSYFSEKWAVANLYLKVECTNCSTLIKIYSYSFYKDMEIADCKVLTKGPLFIKTSCAFSVKYFVSKNSFEFLPEKENLYLLATQNTSKINSLVEIKKEQFESDSP